MKGGNSPYPTPEAIRTRISRLLSSRLAGCIVAASLVVVAARAQDEREIWVPANHLEVILDEMPRAVVLTPGQYRQLRDEYRRTFREEAPEIAPPQPAVIRSLVLAGTVSTNPAVVPVTATCVIECFTGAWSEVPLPFPTEHLGQVTVDGDAAVRMTTTGRKKKAAPPRLVVRGAGRHTLEAIFHLPVTRQDDGLFLSLTPPRAAASLELTFPAGAEVESDFPFLRQQRVARFALPAGGETGTIRWTARRVAPIPDAATMQLCSYLYHLDATSLRADLGFVLHSELGRIPNRVVIDFPGEFRILQLEGDDLLRWEQQRPRRAMAILQPGSRKTADLRLVIEAPVEGSAEDRDPEITLPAARVQGVHRASGTISLFGSDEIRVKRIETGSLTVPIPDDAENSAAALPGHVASFRFPVDTDPPTVSFSREQRRFIAQVDTLVEMKREEIALTRTVRLFPREGRLFSTLLAPPAEEETLTLSAERDDFSWRRREDGSLVLRWDRGIGAGESDTLSLTTRRTPEGWYGLGSDPVSLDFSPLAIEGPESVSGYLAVAADDSLRIESAGSTGLEPRDARTTPVTGALAWYRLDDYSLSLAVNRRPSEIEGAVTAYVLPRVNSLEVAGQLDLDIQFSAIGDVEIALDDGFAPLLRFDSPLIAEQTLGDDGQTWTLRFHQELQGSVHLPFRLAKPLSMGEEGGQEGSDSEAGDSQRTFSTALPRFRIPAAKRIRGSWVMEANTDTELSFAASGLDEVDSLQVPEVAGYTPRHRVIAAYRYRGSEWELILSGVRHHATDTIATVVDSLRLATVVSVDGPARHQADFTLRSNGDQFLAVALPDEGQLWSLAVDGEPVKPVRAPDGGLRVRLPAHEDSAVPIRVTLVYHTPGREWRAAGKASLAPPRLADAIPVMRSEWILHLPEGYDYRRFRSNLGQDFAVVDRLLLGEATRAAGDVLDLASSPLALATSGSEEMAVFGSGGTAETTDMAALPGGAVERESLMKLEEDTLNAAARLGMEEADQERKNYHDVAREQTRARFLQEVAEGWEMPTPQDLPTDTSTTAVRMVEEKLKTIILPSIEFQDTPLREALAFLQSRSVELDTQESDPAKKGLNIVLHAFGSSPGSVAATPITLRLTNVPLGEALRYTVSLANLKYRVDPQAVYVVPLSTPDQDLYTRVYKVPPTFLSSSFADGGGAAAADPFAAPVESQGAITARRTAKDILEDAGITFGPGSTAVFNQETGQLIVRNTTDQMELVEAYNDSLASGPEPVEVPSTPFGEAGLLPLAFELPESGRSYRFHGFYAPSTISFRFVDWERQIRLAWWWIVAGGLVFWFGARRRLRQPVFLGLAGVILLTFLPLVVSPSLTAWCNALLAGWGTAMLLGLIIHCARRLSPDEA